ncbi:unnamed protein product [Cylindrotheca closterium]|uniref:Uncharacterized protein n=1 Tax=Cylindrotheca closterium TaxID=2856 RepID=A0AAD2G7Z1_9STRA|nr:unnamed protein product [Cylindrotheca closterium]
MVAELGQYVHAIGTDSNNSMEPQSIEAIYIEPTKGQHTGHRVLNLNTKKMISQPKVVVLPRDLETFQDGDQITGVDDTEQGYLEEAFDQDYEPEDEDERDFNLRGQFDDINDSEREELLADADNDVDDIPELTVRFGGDDDYESDEDNNLGDEGNEEEEPIVANLDHHQENVDRGTDYIESLVTDLEDLKEGEIVVEPEEPQVAKVTRSGQTYAQAAMSTTCVIDAHKGRDIMTLDVPNAFIQTYMPDAKEGEDRVYMKITGMMVQILIDMAPEYCKYVVLENGKREIYVRVLRAVYGMLQLSLLFYNQFQSDLEAKGFVFNLYDPCVANKVVNENRKLSDFMLKIICQVTWIRK